MRILIYEILFKRFFDSALDGSFTSFIFNHNGFLKMDAPEHRELVKKWRAANGWKKMTTFDFLNAESKIWSIGYWKGEWEKEMVQKYNPFMLAFEPVPAFYQQGQKEFENNPKVSILPFGLGNKNKIVDMNVDADSTSVFRSSEKKYLSEYGLHEPCKPNLHQVQIRSIVGFIAESKIDNVDLMICNCEGGEYELFPALIKSSSIQRFKFLIIQFHDLTSTHPSERKVIREGLRKTHTETLCYKWIFEFWKLKL